MDTDFLLNLLSETIYFLAFFCAFLLFAVIRGRQAIINVITGLYLALLLSSVFPFYDDVATFTDNPKTLAVIKLLIFGALTLFSTLLFYRIMPEAFREGAFESAGKKAVFALSATILVMIFSFKVLPISEFMTPGTPIQTLFAPPEFFFWWLIIPLLALFIL